MDDKYLADFIGVALIVGVCGRWGLSACLRGFFVVVAFAIIYFVALLSLIFLDGTELGDYLLARMIFALICVIVVLKFVVIMVRKVQELVFLLFSLDGLSKGIDKFWGIILGAILALVYILH